MKTHHIVSTRFLYEDIFDNGQIFKDSYRYKSKDILMNSFIKTLDNQDDKDFICVILTHEKNKKFVQYIDFPFDTKVFTYNEFINYIKSCISRFDYVIHTTCDYDDFFHKENLFLIKNSIRENTTFKMYGFTKGATLIRGEKEPHLFAPDYIGKDGFFSCCTSIIYSTKLNFSENFPYLIHDVAKNYNGNHPNWKHIIEKEYKNWGLKTLDEDFFDYPNEDKVRFIWIRQPLSITTMKLNKENKPLHLSDKILKLNLKNDFGYEC